MVRSFIIVFLFLCLRIHDRILFPAFWAEDSTIFYVESIKYGMQSFLRPYTGYFHTIPRLVSFILSTVPLPFIPAIYAIVSLAIFCCCVSYFLSTKFRHILLSDSQRLYVALAICIAPGTFEVLGNLTNLHWILAFFLALLGMKKIQDRYTFFEKAFGFLAIFSTGEGVLFLPIFIYRWFWSLKKDKSGRSIFSKIGDQFANNGLFVFLLTLSLLLNSVLSGGSGLLRSRLQETGISFYFWSWMYGVLNWMVIQPLFGFRLGHNIETYAPPIFWMVNILVLIFAVRSIVRNYRQDAWLWPVCLCITGCVPLTALLRPYASTFFSNPILNQWPDNFRYEFILAPYAIVCWAVLLSEKKINILNSYYLSVLYLFLGAYTLQNASNHFFIPRYEVAHISIAEVYSKYAGSVTIVPPIAPKGWPTPSNWKTVPNSKE
jgi:hypothetical protein